MVNEKLATFLEENPAVAKDIFEKAMAASRAREAAKKAREEGLSEDELAERDKLRRIYIDSVKANLVGQLENTYIVSPDGTKKKVTHK